MAPAELAVDGIARHAGQPPALERGTGEAGIPLEASVEPGPGEQRIERPDAGVDAELEPLATGALRIAIGGATGDVAIGDDVAADIDAEQAGAQEGLA